MYAVVIPCRGEPYIVPTKGPIVEYEEMKEIISKLPYPFKWFEIIKVNVKGTSCLMYIDEDGKLKDWLYNPLATKLDRKTHGRERDYIVGDAVLLLDKNNANTYAFDDDRILAELK